MIFEVKMIVGIAGPLAVGWFLYARSARLGARRALP
jgi:hypothetical protein